MNLHLQNKVILITDGADYLVSVIADALEKEGAIPCRIPLISPDYCVKSVHEAIQRYGRIDGLVNTLDKYERVGLESGDYSNFLKSLEQYVLYAYLTTQAARPWLTEAGGAIVNLISTGHIAGNGSRIGLTAAWADELSGQGIRVNGVVVTSNQTAVAETVSFLLSPAANGLQGELVHVDAGYMHLARELDIST
jgi:L-fucose dehydrogenase